MTEATALEAGCKDLYTNLAARLDKKSAVLEVESTSVPLNVVCLSATLLPVGQFTLDVVSSKRLLDATAARRLLTKLKHLIVASKEFDLAQATMPFGEYAIDKCAGWMNKALSETSTTYTRLATTCQKLTNDPKLKILGDAIDSDEFPNNDAKFVDIPNTKEAVEFFTFWKEVVALDSAEKEWMPQFEALLPLCKSLPDFNGLAKLTKAISDLVAVPRQLCSKEVLEKGGLIVGTLIGVQAGWRKLAPGETRSTLVSKALKGIPNRPYMSVNKKRAIHLQGMS